MRLAGCCNTRAVLVQGLQMHRALHATASRLRISSLFSAFYSPPFSLAFPSAIHVHILFYSSPLPPRRTFGHPDVPSFLVLSIHQLPPHSPAANPLHRNTKCLHPALFVRRPLSRSTRICEKHESQAMCRNLTCICHPRPSLSLQSEKTRPAQP